jgi:23S rRNA (cytosine1962-C5)-methyltransferase
MGRERTLRLRRPLERRIVEGHPWIFRDALDPAPDRPGVEVTILDRRGRFLARGITDGGPLGARVWTLVDERVDDALIARRLTGAVALRSRVVPADTSAYRVVHGEGDRMPGIVCDRYGDHAVVTFDSEGARALEESFLAALSAALPPGVEHVLVRAGRGEDKTVRAVRGKSPVDPLVVEEHGMRLVADLVHGQKTGLFLDHRESRERVRELADGGRVLNLYGYTGGFSIAAGRGGAHAVDTVDTAAPALELATRGWALNGLEPGRHAVHRLDVPRYLEARLAKPGPKLDLVISDPPSFAPNAGAVRAALKAYTALHTACIRLVEPGGLYLAASCSSHIRGDDFEQTLRDGARRARSVLQVLDRWGAPPDHPRLLSFPEGDYLKVVLLRVLA